MNFGVWALFLACIAGILMCAGSLTRLRETAAVVALLLFAIAGVMALIPVVQA